MSESAYNPNNRDTDLLGAHDALESDAAIMGYIVARLDKIEQMMNMDDRRGPAGIELNRLRSWAVGQQTKARGMLLRMRQPED